METWFLANPDAYRCNANGVVFGASASMLFFTGLLANIAIYVSFVISPHDDHYLVLVMAICLMFSGSLASTCTTTRIRSRSTRRTAPAASSSSPSSSS